MKRKIVSALIMMTMVASMCACGKTGDGANPTNGENTTGGTAIENGEKKDGNEIGSTGNGLFEAFLNNEVPATIGECEANLYYDEEYYFSDYIHGYEATAAIDWNVVKVTSIQYAYVDAANDGIDDLAVKIILNSDYVDDITYNLLFMQVGDKLVLAADGCGFYRTESTINKSGVIQTGGSDGATSYGWNYVTADANGEYRVLYSMYVDMGYANPVIPAYAFEDYEAVPADYPTDYAETNYYEISRYTFGRYEDAKSYYVINKEDGTEVSPMEEYSDLYKEQGINAVSGDLIDDLIDKELKAVNLTKDSLLETEPEWKNLDPAKYAEVYGNDWASGYNSFICTNGCIDFLNEPYELMYSYEPLVYSGYSIAELTGDDAPELLVLYSSSFSVGAQVISVYTYNEEKKTVELLSTVTNEGVSKGHYADYVPSDSFSKTVANNYDCVAGLSQDGDLVIFGNWGDGYFSFEMKTVSFKGEMETNTVFGEYYFPENGTGESSGDKNKAKEIFETYSPLMFFDSYEITEYLNSNYKETDIYNFSAEEVQQFLNYKYNYIIDLDTEDIWDGVVVSEDYSIYYSRDYMMQYYNYGYGE